MYTVNMPSWKLTQTKTKTKKRNRLAFTVLFLVAALLLFSWLFHLTQTLFSPLKGSQVQRNYRWNGEFSVNLAVRTNGISVLSYNPRDEKIVIISIPDETFLEVPHGFGNWQLRAVYGLGQGQLLKDTLTNFLGVPVDGFLDISSEKSGSDFVQVLRENPFSGLKYLSTLKTDLTIWELYKLKTGLSTVRFDKIELMDLAKAHMLDRGKLPDGTDIYTADPVKIDSVLAGFADPAIVSEHKTIAIFNATDKPQLAQKWARLITNSGGNVIITTNAKKRISNTQVLGEESKTLNRLRQIFDLGCQNKPKCDIISESDEDLVSSRAQINLFLGEDYANK